ncbi:hypothetical protein DOTSEDRAFT_70112 [Dothistroma septosporum NZE10]|uniref:Uncharacterized protein n=1 Tax=Dothistroma septosporum (strain NZE10 / CBS 128990) TaxID=675120 RepID=N1PUF2_DOTSN|nr:hypothetical protein DOTSEDRAFT_70112 [Dothistroma septosporum NZE10]
MMSSFRKARTVIVWLGEHGEHTKPSLPLTTSHGCPVPIPASTKATTLARLTVLHVQTNHSSVCVDKVKLLIQGIEDLCDGKWVSRIWVRQVVWVDEAI